VQESFRERLEYVSVPDHEDIQPVLKGGSIPTTKYEM